MDNAGLLTTIMKYIPFLGVKKMAHTVHCDYSIYGLLTMTLSMHLRLEQTEETFMFAQPPSSQP